MALIKLDRALNYILNYPEDHLVMIQQVHRGVEAFVKKWCNRDFEITNYDETYPGEYGRSLLLNQFPVTAVSAVRTGLDSLLTVQNTDTTNSVATVRVTSTGVSLISTKNGTSTLSTFLFADYVTITALAAAIAGESGWTATVAGNYGGWASSDLPVQGAFDALQGATGLSSHTTYLSDYMLDADTGELTLPCRVASPWAKQAYRIQYTAGFATIPEDLQQAVTELVAAVYMEVGLNPNLQSESLGGYSYVASSVVGNRKSFEQLSVVARLALSNYRNIRIARFN